MIIYDSLSALLGLAAGILAVWILQRPARAAVHATIADQRARIGALDAALAGARADVHRLELAAAAAAATALAEKESLAREHAAFLDDRRRMEQSFREIGSEVLDANARKVAEVARHVLAEQQALAKGDLDLRKAEVEKLIEPVSETLTKLDTQIRSLETTRAGAYEELKTKVEALALGSSTLTEKAEELARTTVGLMQALRSSGARGRWGEIQLRRIVELAGMLPHCDFEEQATVATQAGIERPDMCVLLPGGRFVVVDAKAPLTAYLEAIEALDDAARGIKLKGHARAVRAHVETLARREYRRHDSHTPDLKIMFVPSEGALAAALTEDPAIFDDAIARGICIASPTTLIAMLRMMNMGWRQEAIEENARRIAELGSELYERIGKVGALLAKVGARLGSTVSAYNELLGSTETRLLVTARRFRDMGVVPACDELEDIAPIELGVRDVHAMELLAIGSRFGTP